MSLSAAIAFGGPLLFGAVSLFLVWYSDRKERREGKK
jgi:hypothetical protein